MISDERTMRDLGGLAVVLLVGFPFVVATVVWAQAPKIIAIGYGICTLWPIGAFLWVRRRRRRHVAPPEERHG